MSQHAEYLLLDLPVGLDAALVSIAAQTTNRCSELVSAFLATERLREACPLVAIAVIVSRIIAGPKQNRITREVLANLNIDAERQAVKLLGVQRYFAATSHASLVRADSKL